MKRWLAFLLLLTGCGPQPSSLPLTAGLSAQAAAIPEGRTPEERREIFKAAMALYDRGDRPGAERLFTTVAAVYPELADYGLRHLAKIAEARGDPQTALGNWQALAARYPDSVWNGEAALALGRASAEGRDWDTASSWLAAARRDLANPSERATALGLSIQVARARGDGGEARSLSTELRSRYGVSPEAERVRAEAWSERETVALASAEAAIAEVSLRLAEGDATRALELARAAEQRFSAHRDRPEILRLQATALMKTGETEEGTRLLERIRVSYPRHPAAAQAVYRLASLAWNRDDDATALQLFDLYARIYSRGAQAPETIYAIARIHQEAGRYEPAGREFARLARLYPESQLAPEASWRVGWCAYRGGNRARAADVFAQVAARNTSERPAALYWRARSLASSAGDGYEAIVQEFPGSYYARLAEQRLGQSEGAGLAGRLSPGRTPDPEPPCTSGDPHLARFTELKAMSLSPLARRELAAYQQRAQSCDGFLMPAWLEVGGYRQSVLRAIHAGACEIGSPRLTFCYPLGFWQTIQRAAAATALDPYLVTALIRQESLFDAEARSSANAIGLMQILPTTGARLASRTGRQGFRPEALVDPEENVALGTTYLKDLLERYQGNLPRVLAAYNAGEAAADKWQRRNPDLEDDEFVESISYRETRSYVKRVLQNRRIYQILYERSAGGGAAS